jgi:Flp pilus assembly protein TadB
MSNAFAPLQQARPCPTLGRPVRLRVAPIDYGPAVLRMPFGFRLTTDTLPSGRLQAGGFRFPLAVSGFHLRARVGCSIPSSLLPASEELPPPLDIALLIRAREGLQPS